MVSQSFGPWLIIGSFQLVSVSMWTWWDHCVMVRTVASQVGPIEALGKGRDRVNPLNPAGGLSGLRKQRPRNPAGRFSGICYGVSKTRRAFKPAHVRLIIQWFVYTGRYQATLRSQVESSSLFSFRTICNLLTGFCTRYTNLRRKYGGDTRCMWRYRYSLHVMDNVEE